MDLNIKDILLLIQNNNSNDAIIHLNQLIQNNKNNSDYYYLKGIAYFKLNKFIEAAKDFNKSISLNPKFAEVYNNLAIVNYTIGKNEEAIKNFIKSIKLKHNYKEAISGLINTLSHTNNVEVNESEIVSTHNKINNINYYYSSIEYINEENIKKFLEEANKIIDNNLNNLEFNLTQTYRRYKTILNCNRHKKIFNKYDAIPQYCFGCFKVQIELESVVDLLKLYIIFDNINFPNNNLRKCMIELRSNVQGKYKGLVYCNSIEESENILNHLRKVIDKNFNKTIVSKIKKGCSEYGIKYLKYDNLTDEAMTYNPEWKKYENLIDEKYPDLALEKISRPTIKGISLYDILVIRNWLTYARIIGDKSYKSISDQPYNSKYLEQKLKSINY